MMYSIVETNSRAQFISFGHAIGQTLLESGRNKPWFITLGGEENSGKSLMALAIDQVLNPARYPAGLGEISIYDTVEVKLEPGNDGNPQVVFKNFFLNLGTSGNEFDEILTGFSKENPKARVLIGSNLERTAYGMSGLFDYSRGVDSKVLDLNMDIWTFSTAFVRRIELAAGNKDLLPKIIARYNVLYNQNAQNVDPEPKRPAEGGGIDSRPDSPPGTR